MSSPDQTGSQSPEDNDSRSHAPDVAGVPAAWGEELAPRGAALEWGSAGVVLLLLIGLPIVVVFLLLLVILPIRDGKKSDESAWETYSELHSMSYRASWETDSEIYSVQASLDSGLSALDWGLWSVSLDLGSLAYDGGFETRPGARELEDAINAHQDELRQFRRSADARFDELRDSVAARLGGLEDATDGALDDHWDESSRRFDRDGRIVMGALWFIFFVCLATGLTGLWVSWHNCRALVQPAGGTP
jgi:hypothetical protein